MERKNKVYKILQITVILVICFIIGIRFGKIAVINKQFERGMVKDENAGKQVKYISKEDGYIFNYSKGTFFNTECFASVCEEEDAEMFIDENGNLYTKDMQVTLFFWPYQKKYGLDFFQLKDGKEFSRQVYVDKELNYLSESGQEDYFSINELLKDNKEKIKNLFYAAEEKWNLN